MIAWTVVYLLGLVAVCTVVFGERVPEGKKPRPAIKLFLECMAYPVLALWFAWVFIKCKVVK
jgi:hypothetical protein